MARRGAGDNTMLLLGLGAGALLLMSRGNAGAPIPIGDGRLLYPDGTIRDTTGQIIARTTPQTYQAAVTAKRTATQAARSAGVQEPTTLQQIQQYASMAPALFGAATSIFKAIDQAFADPVSSMPGVEAEAVAWGGTTEEAQQAFADYRAMERAYEYQEPTWEYEYTPPTDSLYWLGDQFVPDQYDVPILDTGFAEAGSIEAAGDYAFTW